MLTFNFKISLEEEDEEEPSSRKRKRSARGEHKEKVKLSHFDYGINDLALLGQHQIHLHISVENEFPNSNVKNQISWKTLQNAIADLKDANLSTLLEGLAKDDSCKRKVLEYVSVQSFFFK